MKALRGFLFFIQYMPRFRIELITIALFLSLFPLFPLTNFAEYDEKRWLMIITCSLVILLTPMAAVRHFLRCQPWLTGILVALLLGVFLSLAQTNSPHTAVLHGLALLMLCGYACCIAQQQQSIQHSYFYPALFIGLFMLHANISLMVMFEMLHRKPIDPWLILVGFENQRFFNQLQVLTIPALIFFLTHPRFGKLNTVTLWMSLLQIMLTGGRGAMLTILLLLLSLYWFSKFRHLARLSTKITVLALITYLGITLLPTEPSFYLFRTGSSYRLEMWQELLTGLTWSNLWFGYGGGNYPINTLLTAMSHPHNFLLQSLVEWGFIATIALLLFYCKPLLMVRQHLPQSDNIDMIIPALTISAALIYGLVDGILVMPLSQLLFYTWLGLLIQSLKLQSSTDAKPEHQLASHSVNTSSLVYRLRAIKIADIAKIAVVITFVVLCWQSYSFYVSESKQFHGPSFWFHGDPWITD